MSHCAIFGCNNSRKNTADVKFFRFPSDEELAKKWEVLCYRSDAFNVKTARICSVHFNENSYYKSMRERLLNYSPVNARKLKKDALPIIHLPQTKCGKDVPRSRRQATRARKIVRDVLMKPCSVELSSAELQRGSGHQREGAIMPEAVWLPENADTISNMKKEPEEEIFPDSVMEDDSHSSNNTSEEETLQNEAELKEEAESIMKLKTEMEIEEHSILPESNHDGEDGEEQHDLTWESLDGQRKKRFKSGTCAKKRKLLRGGYRSRQGSVHTSSSGIQRNKTSVTNIAEEEALHLQNAQKFDKEASLEIPTSSSTTSTSVMRHREKSALGGKQKEESDMITKYVEDRLKMMETKSSMTYFWQSLLDDISRLSEKGQRTFKIEVLKLLNNLLDSEGDH